MLLYGISGTYQPTVQASIPVLVASKDILPAGAIVNQIGALEGLLSPIIGGMLFGAFGIIPILIISVICFVTSAIMEIINLLLTAMLIVGTPILIVKTLKSFHWCLKKYLRK